MNYDYEGNLRELNYRNQGLIHTIKSKLQPYWSKLTYFEPGLVYTDSMDTFLVRIQLFTDVTLSLNIYIRRRKIIQQMAGNEVCNYKKAEDFPRDDYEEEFPFPLHGSIFPLKCDISFSSKGQIRFNASNYVIMSQMVTLENEHIQILNQFHQQNFELAVISECENSATSFNGTVTNLFLDPRDISRTNIIRSTLICFPRVRHLEINLAYYKALDETFSCEMFRNLESITIEVLSCGDVAELLPKLSRFLNPTTMKRLVASDCDEICVEEIAWNLGWELLPPRSYIGTVHHIELLCSKKLKK